MKTSLTIAKINDIPLKLHWTFSLLLLWAAGQGYQWFGGWWGSGLALLLKSLLFLCVIGHEVGHALTAKAFGLQTKHIMIFPFGGMAQISYIPATGWPELMIALAGPAVNFVLMMVFMLIFFLQWGSEFLQRLLSMPSTILPWLIQAAFDEQLALSLVAYLILINAFLTLFNLIPAFPMDGGRIFRAFLSTQLPYIQATQIAVRIGQLFALGLIILTLTPYFGLQSPSTVFIGRRHFLGRAHNSPLGRLTPTLCGAYCFHPRHDTRLARTVTARNHGTSLKDAPSRPARHRSRRLNRHPPRR